MPADPPRHNRMADRLPGVPEHNGRALTQLAAELDLWAVPGHRLL